MIEYCVHLFILFVLMGTAAYIIYTGGGPEHDSDDWGG